jgi:hypothetical protein
MNEKIVIVVHKMLDYVVEMEFWIMVKVVKHVQWMLVVVNYVGMER